MARKKKDSDWRKKKREHGGSVYEYKGKLYARIQYLDESGNRKDKKVVVTSRSAARKLFRELRKKLEDHGEKAVDAYNLTFKELADTYEKVKLIPPVIVDGRKVAGLRSYKSAKGFLLPLRDYFGRRHIRGIKHSDLETFRLERLQTAVRSGTDKKGKPVYRARKMASVNRELELARAMFRYAHREGWITRSPFETGAGLIAKEAEVTRERVLSYDEERRLLEACGPRTVTYKRSAHKRRGHTIAARQITATDGEERRRCLRTLIITALDTAMRRGELFKLKWPEVDFTSNLIRVQATNTKTERARTVGMTPRVRSALLELKLAAPPDSDGLVFGITGTIKNGFHAALREAKIKNFRLHDARHTAITRMIAAGLPATEVMKISGHTQFNTFKRYVNPTEDSARKGAELLAAYQQSQTVTSQSEAVN